MVVGGQGPAWGPAWGQGWSSWSSWSDGKSKGKGAQAAEAAEAPAEDSKPATSARLLVSGLPPYMTEDMLQDVFGSYGLVQVQVLEDAKASKDDSLQSVAMLQLTTEEEATKMLKELDGKVPDGLMEPVTMKYENAGEDKKSKAGQAYTIYVGDLPADMDEDTFVSICGMKGTLLQAKINKTGNCGYATFASEQDSQLAIEIVNGFEYNGVTLSARPADAAEATKMMHSVHKPEPNMSRPHTNKLYVRGLKPGITNEEVLAIFEPHGEVEDVRVLFTDEWTGAGAMVYMASPWKAAELVQELDGMVLPGTFNPLRVKLADTPAEYDRRKATQALWQTWQAMKGGKGASGNEAKGKGAGKGEQESGEAAEGVEDKSAKDPVTVPALKKRKMTRAPPKLAGMSASAEPVLKVDGLPEWADEWYLLKAFSRFGSLAGIEVNWDVEADKCSGSGYIKYMQTSGSEKAVAASGLPAHDGSPLDVWPKYMTEDAEPDKAPSAAAAPKEWWED